MKEENVAARGGTGGEPNESPQLSCMQLAASDKDRSVNDNVAVHSKWHGTG